MANRHDAWNGHLGAPKGKPHKFMQIGDRVEEVHSVVAHRIRMGDVEDPDLLVAQPIWEWQQTEIGKFIMERSVETPMWHRQVDPMTYGHNYLIQAWLAGKDYTFWQLKYAPTIDALK